MRAQEDAVEKARLAALEEALTSSSSEPPVDLFFDKVAAAKAAKEARELAAQEASDEAARADQGAPLEKGKGHGKVSARNAH